MEYTINSTVFGDWKITEKIGEGSYGTVYKIQKTDYGITTYSALKVIRIPRSNADIKAALNEGMDEQSVTTYFQGFVEEIVQEISVMASLKSHPNIVNYEDHRVLNHSGEIGWDILIRMELLIPLQDYIFTHNMDEYDILTLTENLCSALAFCQKKGLIHRDIKPENIFVTENGQFKLGDFGVARTIEKTTGGLSKKGTESYMAPEVYLNKPYGSSVDIYSLGLVIYKFMNNNRLPFLPPLPQPITFADRENALSRRMKGEALPAPVNASKEFADIILKACAYKPEERYHTAADMLEDIHNFKPRCTKTVAVMPDIPEVPSPSEETKGIFDAASSEETIGLWNIAVPQNEAENGRLNSACEEAETSEKNGEIESQINDTLSKNYIRDSSLNEKNPQTGLSSPSEHTIGLWETEIGTEYVLHSDKNISAEIQEDTTPPLSPPVAKTLETDAVKNKKLPLHILIIPVLVILISGSIIFLSMNSPEKKLEEKINLADTYMEAGEYTEAISHYTEAINSEKPDGELFKKIVTCYLFENDTDKALEFIQSTIASNLDEAVKEELTYICYLQKICEIVTVKKYEDYIEFCQTEKENLSAWYSDGIHYYQNGEILSLSECDMQKPIMKINKNQNHFGIFIGTLDSQGTPSGEGASVNVFFETNNYYYAEGTWENGAVTGSALCRETKKTSASNNTFNEWIFTTSGNVVSDYFDGDITFQWQKSDGSEADSSLIHAQKGTYDCLEQTRYNERIYARGSSGKTWSTDENGLKNHSYKLYQ